MSTTNRYYLGSSAFAVLEDAALGALTKVAVRRIAGASVETVLVVVPAVLEEQQPEAALVQPVPVLDTLVAVAVPVLEEQQLEAGFASLAVVVAVADLEQQALVVSFATVVAVAVEPLVQPVVVVAVLVASVLVVAALEACGHCA